MAIRWDSESDWKNSQDSSGTTGRNGNLRQGYSRERPDLSDGLIGYWPLHDDSATDYSGNNNHGTLNGGITTGVAGKAGIQAMSFDGNDDNVRTGNTSMLDGSTNMTIAVWVKWNSFSGNKYIVGRHWSDAVFGIRDNSDGTMGFRYNDNNQINTNTSLATDEWRHLVVTWDGSTIRFYIDAVEDASTSASNNVSAPNELCIGSLGDGSGSYGNFADATLADVRIYDSALSSEEVNTLYNWGSGDYARPLNDQNSSSVVSRWAFDSNANDSWSSNNGTLNGDASVGNSDTIRGGSLALDGSGDYVEIGDSSNLNPSEITISLWMNIVTGDNNEAVIEKTTGVNDDGYTFYDTAASTDYWYWNVVDTAGNRYNLEIRDKYIKQAQWQHVVLSYNPANSEIEAYVNGRKVASQNTNGNDIQSNSAPLYIGSDTFEEDFVEGKIDDVRIYDQALAPHEVFRLYRYGTRGRDMRKQLVNY